jgi:DNA-binding PucR family transcriptional regulator
VLDRLRRVEQLTGRCVERPADVVEVALARQALALRAGAPERPVAR